MRSASTEQSAPEARARLSEKGRDRMWFTKALVAYDGSAASKNAVDLAMEMAKDSDQTQFLFVHVLKLPPVRSGTGVEAMFAEEAQNTLADLERMVAPLGDRAQARILRGTSRRRGGLRPHHHRQPRARRRVGLPGKRQLRRGPGIADRGAGREVAAVSRSKSIR